MRAYALFVFPHPPSFLGHLPPGEGSGGTDCPLVGVDALIDPNQNITMRSRDDVGIVPYGVLSEVLGHLRGIATPV